MKFHLTRIIKVTELLVESDPNLTLRYDPIGNLPWCCAPKKGELFISS